MPRRLGSQPGTLYNVCAEKHSCVWAPSLGYRCLSTPKGLSEWELSCISSRHLPSLSSSYLFRLLRSRHLAGMSLTRVVATTPPSLAVTSDKINELGCDMVVRGAEADRGPSVPPRLEIKMPWRTQAPSPGQRPKCLSVCEHPCVAMVGDLTAWA